MDIEVKVPATVANLGPGFDCLGVAVGVYLQMRFTRSDTPSIIGKGRIRSVPDSLVYRAFTAAFAAADQPAPTVTIEMMKIYPSARGMGASASAIVGGLVAARACGDLPLTDAELARLAVRIEGHGDNVLSALFGGLVLNSHDGWLRFEPTPSIAPLLLTARHKFKTAEARRVLPTDIPRIDSVANTAATAALVAALIGSAVPDSLLLATEDRIHEPYRLPLMPESLDLHEALRGKGIATALAGAGPSLICLVRIDELRDVEEMATSLVPEGWGVLAPGWDLVGAQVR